MVVLLLRTMFLLTYDNILRENSVVNQIHQRTREGSNHVLVDNFGNEQMYLPFSRRFHSANCFSSSSASFKFVIDPSLSVNRQDVVDWWTPEISVSMSIGACNWFGAK